MELRLALPPVDTTQEAFLREVDEGLRADQAIHIWKKWGMWIVGLVVAGLLAFGGILYFQDRDTRIAGKQGEQYDEALRDIGASRAAKADPALQSLAASGKPGYRAMARFAQAHALLDKNDLKGAAAKFGEIAGDTTLDKPFRELALLRQTSAEYDSLKPEIVIDRLKELAVPDSAWFGSAGEMVASAYMKQGKRDLAGKLYAQIAKAEKVPPSIRQRAVQMAGVLGIDAIDQSGEKKAQ
jgi:hypothetical protein